MNHVDANGNFALKYSVNQRNMAEISRLLDEKKAEINLRDTLGRTVLHWAVNIANTSTDASFDLERLLLEHDADINAVD